MEQPRVWSQCSSWARDPDLRRQWWAAMLAGLAALFPLLMSVDLYIDDIERAMDGSLGWVRVGRPLADVLVGWLNFGHPVTAVAPLNTVVAMVLLSAVGVACARAYGIRSPFWTAMASLPLMAQPYALQALSYGFDAVFMAAALAAAVVAALIVNAQGRWRYVALALVLQLVAFNLYQPAANGFLVMTGCLCIAASLGLLHPTGQRQSLRARLLVSAAVYGGGYGLYRLLFALLFEHRLNRYASSAAAFKPLDWQLPFALLGSALEPIQQVLRDFGAWPVVLPLIVLLLTYAGLLRAVCGWRTMARVLAFSVVVLLLAPGGMVLLRESFVRHPRVLLYFGPFLTSLILQILVLTRLQGRRIWRLGVLPLIWLMVVVSYAYGHAFAAQASFEHSRLSRIVAAASTLTAREDQSPAQFLMVEGTMPRSPVLKNTVRKFPVIDRLIPPLLNGNQTFSFSQLRLNGLALEKRRPEDFKEMWPKVCEPSPDAICTSEFSLQRVGADTLVLQLAPGGEMRPET